TRVWLSPYIKKWVYCVNHWIHGVSDQSLFCYEVGERFAQLFEHIASPEVVKDVIGGWSEVCVFLFPFSFGQCSGSIGPVEYMVCQMDKGVHCHHKLGDFH